MTDYKQKQYSLFREIEAKFKRGENPSTIVEPLQDFENDQQICLTSVVFIPSELEGIIIKKVTKSLQVIDDRQYYYIPSSLHCTIQNIRTVHYPPLFDEDNIVKVQEVFQRVIPQHARFDFSLKGLFELPTSIAVQAFSKEVHKDLVLHLREELTKAGVPDNKTYASSDVIFGNATICRFTSDPNQDFKNKVKELKDVDIGTFTVKGVDIITTNSACIPAKTTIIGKYHLQ